MKKLTNQMKKWGGEFGKKYTDRNILSVQQLNKMFLELEGTTRTKMNSIFLKGIPKSARILEVGSNVGNQLLCLQAMGYTNLYGVELQPYAVELSKKRTKNINIIQGSAFDLPYKDGFFDLVFTSGVLIHLSPKDISGALSEIVRCSGKYVWGFEYFAEKYTALSYQGNQELMWKTDFAKLYRQKHPKLKLVKEIRYKNRGSENVDTMFLLKK